MMTLYDVHRLVRLVSLYPGPIRSQCIRRTHSRLGSRQLENCSRYHRLPDGYRAHIVPAPVEPPWTLHRHRQLGGLRLQLLRKNRAYIGSTARP